MRIYTPKNSLLIDTAEIAASEEAIAEAIATPIEATPAEKAAAKESTAAAAARIEAIALEQRIKDISTTNAIKAREIVRTAASIASKQATEAINIKKSKVTATPIKMAFGINTPKNAPEPLLFGSTASSAASVPSISSNKSCDDPGTLPSSQESYRLLV